MDSLNNLTVNEQVYLEASFRYNTMDAFKCKDKLKELLQDKQMKAYQKKLDLCKATAKGRYRFHDRYSYDKCLCNYLIESDMYYYLNLHQQYENGILPYPGSLVDQPAKIIEIFNFLALMKAELHERQEKEQKQKEALKGRK